jgi:hypothetical protein
MIILTKIPECFDERYLTERYKSTFYQISEPVEHYVQNIINNQSTTVLFSGNYKCSKNSTFIEPAMFSKAKISWQANTLFVDPAKTKVVEYVIKKINADILCILNSATFVQYQDWQIIFKKIENYKKISKNLLITIPINRFNFNRLKYSYAQIATKLGGVIVDNTIIIWQ